MCQANKSKNSIDGDELIPDTKYEMKIWKKRSARFRSRVLVTFICYCDSKGLFSKDDFDMKNLDPSDLKNCIVTDLNGNVTVLTNRHDRKIWTTSGNDRVTFDEIPTSTI